MNEDDNFNRASVYLHIEQCLVYATWRLKRDAALACASGMRPEEVATLRAGIDLLSQACEVFEQTLTTQSVAPDWRKRLRWMRAPRRHRDEGR
jgi:hypothetical protein